MPRPHTHTAALLLSALAVGSSGCDDSNERLTLTLLDPPPGGEVPALAVTPNGTLLAPTAHGVFALTDSREPWQRWRTSWPHALKPNPQVTLEGLTRTGSTFPFGNEELLAEAGDALWMLSESSPGAPVLLRSDDGRHWTLAPLPTDYIPVTSEFGISQPSSPALSGAPISPALTLRLLSGGEALYLIDSTKVWKHERPGVAPSSTSWTEVSLEGIDLERASVRLELPASLRHYLPASDARPYELLTVLTDQVLVYRRAVDTPSFVLIHAQPRLDRALVAPGDGKDVFALTHDAILASRDEGERWDALKPNAASALSAIEILEGTPRAIVVGTEDGAIWLDESGDGRAWKRTRDPDPDGRAIHDLIAHGTSLYASTEGQGVLRSVDRGATWAPVTGGLDAAKAGALASSTSGGVLVGTDAGLFGLETVDGVHSWRPLHSRATTALLSGDVTLSGTRGGDIVAGGGVTWATLDAFANVKPRPIRHPSVWAASASPTSVTQISRQPGAQALLATANQRGVATSVDGSRWGIEPHDPALDDALGQAPVLSEVTSHDGTRFALSGASDIVPAQVWRRRKGRWSAVHALPDTSTPAFLLATDEALWLAHGSTLERSVDGDVWRASDTPWGQRVVVAARARSARLEFTLMGERSHEFFAMERGEVTAHHTLTFESGWNPPEPHDVLLTDDHVYALTPHGIFVSSLKASRRELPRGASMFLVIGATVFLAMGGFAVMRGGRARRR